MRTEFTIALAGNPNCGKTSLFNALTGARQHVGNYPGVTVESKSGKFTLNGMEITLIDLPGVYSLSSSSPEEDIVFQELTKPGIDLILNVVDSTIPQRSLYLTTQLAELHIPMLLAFNMADDAKRKGLKFNIEKLQTYFGSPVVQTIGNKSGGIQRLLTKLADTLTKLDSHGVPMLSYGQDIDDSVLAVSTKIDELNIEKYKHVPSRFFAIKLLEHDSCVQRIPEFKPVHDEVNVQIKHLLAKHAIETDTFMADKRYAMLAGACRDTITFTQARRREISDKIDIIMTNKYFGLPLFLLIIYATFWFTFTLADPLMGYIETGFDLLAETVQGSWQETTLPYLRSLITDGVIKGVGGVLVFLPNILFLFFAIALLEDSGYMARAAFVMDGIMRRFGLQGRSFVPLVLGFGCNVPAIMATRTIESNRDRTVTIMVLPLMSCGARLPIYALIIPAFFSGRYQAFVMWLMYLIGIVIALIAARIMKSTIFKGDGEIYLMELPPYRMPTVKSLLLHMWDRGKMYIQKAGTIILATSVILYICNTWPQKPESKFKKDYNAAIEQIQKTQVLSIQQMNIVRDSGILDHDTMKEFLKNRALTNEQAELLEKKENLTAEQKAIIKISKERADVIETLENEKKAELMEYTISGRIGHALEPLFRPIGFDWKVTTASLGALAAKEVFVSQLGILYAEGEANEESRPLREHLRQNYTPLQAFCIMLFCLLSIPCLATLAIIRRELNSWLMPFIEALGLFLLAYLSTLLVYQIGSILQIGTKYLS